MAGQDKSYRPQMHEGIERNLMDHTRRISDDPMAKPTECPKCGGIWWVQSTAVIRDALRQGKVSQYHRYTFEFYECIQCGYVDATRTQMPNRQTMNYFRTFTDAIKNRMEWKPSQAKTKESQTEILAPKKEPPKKTTAKK